MTSTETREVMDDVEINLRIICIGLAEKLNSSRFSLNASVKEKANGKTDPRVIVKKKNGKNQV
jgi:hypothetical protein